MPTRILIIGVVHIFLSLIVSTNKLLKEPVIRVEILFAMFVEVTQSDKSHFNGEMG